MKRNFFGKLQGLHCFASIMVLCSLIKFCILEPCTGIQWLRIFYLGPWQILKQVYRELQEAKRFFGKFQGQPLFPRKMVLYSSTKFGIIKTWTNIPWLRRVDLGFRQTWKRFKGISNIWGTFLESLKVCVTFPEKFRIFYLLTKFGTFQSFANIKWLRRFYSDFWLTLK